MVMWLTDKDGNKPEDVFDDEELAKWIDTIISANIPDIEISARSVSVAITAVW